MTTQVVGQAGGGGRGESKPNLQSDTKDVGSVNVECRWGQVGEMTRLMVGHVPGPASPFLPHLQNLNSCQAPRLLSTCGELTGQLLSTHYCHAAFFGENQSSNALKVHVRT